MELVKCMAAAILSAALFCPSWASAQVAVASDDLHQPATVQPAASESDNHLSLASQNGQNQSPNNVPVVPPNPKTDQPAPKADEAAKPEEKAEEEKADEPHRVIGKLGCTGINIYGWLEAGITANPDNPASHYNGTLAPNDRNEFQFNQNYLVIEKTLNTDEHGWDIGGRVDLLYGTDYIYCESLGFETNRDGSPKWNASEQYGLAMPQVYGELGVGKLSAKIGRFYTPIGYESMMATSNFFYSMNYALRYAEATTHTGGLFTWKTSDELSLYVGGVNGQDQTDGLTNSLAALTGFAWTPKDQKYALNFAIMTGGLEPTNDPTVFAPGPTSARTSRTISARSFSPSPNGTPAGSRISIWQATPPISGASRNTCSTRSTITGRLACGTTCSSMARAPNSADSDSAVCREAIHFRCRRETPEPCKRSPRA